MGQADATGTHGGSSRPAHPEGTRSRGGTALARRTPTRAARAGTCVGKELNQGTAETVRRAERARPQQAEARRPREKDVDWITARVPNCDPVYRSTHTQASKKGTTEMRPVPLMCLWTE